MTTPDRTAAIQKEGPASNRGWASHLRSAVLVIAVIACIWMLRWAKPLLVPLVVGIFLTFWLTPLVNGLQRLRVPRSIGAALVLIAVVAGVGGVGYWLSDDTQALVNGLPDAMRHVQSVLNHALHDRGSWLHDLRSTWNQMAPLATGTSSAASNAALAAGASAPVGLEGALIHWSAAAMTAVGSFGVVLFLIYFLLASGDLFKRKLLAAVSGHRPTQRITMGVLDEIGVQLQRYLGVLVITNIAIGAMTWAAFTAMGVQHAAVWGAATAILHVVPYLGAAVIAGTAGVFASVQFESLGHGLMVAAVVLGLSTLIGMVLTTFLAGRASAMNAAAIFIGLLFWGWLWGVAGLLLGTPLMMAIKVITDRVESLRWISQFLSADQSRPRQPRTDA